MNERMGCFISVIWKLRGLMNGPERGRCPLCREGENEMQANTKESKYKYNEGIIYNNNHGSAALYGLGPPLASSFRGYCVVRIRGSW
jgi:hypothetical protein